MDIYNEFDDKSFMKDNNFIEIFKNYRFCSTNCKTRKVLKVEWVGLHSLQIREQKELGHGAHQLNILTTFMKN